MDDKVTVARPVAPEDIKVGSYVMMLARHDEYARWSCDFNAEIQMTKVRWTPCDGQRPRKVLAACLPFVLLEDEKGEATVVDTRNASFARVKRSFAQAVWEKARKSSPDSPCVICGRARS